MNHLTDEQLILHYYGEEPDAGEQGVSACESVEQHLSGCESCREAYQALQRVLNSVDSLPVPERGPGYEARIWREIEHRLPGHKTLRWWSWKPLFVAASMAALMAAAFVAGRRMEKPKAAASVDPQVSERVLLVAVGDHLERSQMILVDLANAGAPKNGDLDIAYEQHAAEDLLESNRLYRETAASSGDAATAALLDDLERVLLEIAHSPSTVSEKQLDELRKQIEDRGILFKVKVFGSQVEHQMETDHGNKL